MGQKRRGRGNIASRFTLLFNNSRNSSPDAGPLKGNEMNQQDLAKILELHALWLQGNKDGEKANLQKVNLQKANLREANLRKADLHRADLRDADLRNADLREANLREVDLWNTILYGADLRKADLRGARLWGCLLHGATLWDPRIQDTEKEVSN